MRNGLLFLHVLSAAAWIGGGLFAVWIYPRIAKSGVSGAGTALKAVAEKAGSFFGPAAGLTLLTGIILVLTRDEWGWGDTFVIVGLAVWVFSALFQALVSGKIEERMLDAAAAESGEMATALRGFYSSAAVEITALVVALYVMIAKVGV